MRELFVDAGLLAVAQADVPLGQAVLDFAVRQGILFEYDDAYAALGQLPGRLGTRHSTAKDGNDMISVGHIAEFWLFATAQHKHYLQRRYTDRRHRPVHAPQSDALGLWLVLSVAVICLSAKVQRGASRKRYAS